MTWAAFHRREQVLRSVLAAADLRRDGELPMDVPGVDDAFGDELNLIAALQMRWHTRLAGEIERQLVESPATPDEAVVSAWRRTAEDLAGVRAILDRHILAPSSAAAGEALRKAQRRDWALLAAMAGRAAPGEARAVAEGRALEERARAASPVAV